jgi:hypothetical protein
MAAIMKRALFNIPAILLVGLLANLLLIAAGNSGVGTPMGDLSFAYQPWADQVLKNGTLLGISSSWVYPYPALVPILLSALATPGHLETAWLVGRTVLMLAVLVALVLYKVDAETRTRRYLAAYAWIGFTFALGPVSISRIDTISVIIAVLGALALATGAQLGAASFWTVASWIKIWPIALFAAISTNRKNWLKVVAYGAAISVGFLVLAFLLGGNLNVFSFITGQGERGLQIESPMATPWLWAAVLGATDAGIYYNHALLTFEVFGPATQQIAFWLGPVQAGAIAITLVLGILGNRAIDKAGTSLTNSDAAARRNEVIAWTAFTGTLDLIVFNKVGSPQFISWLAVPIILGVLLGVKRWQIASSLVLLLSVLTWWVYPVVYDGILSSEAAPTAVLVARNLVEVVALVYANYRLTALSSKIS